MVIDTSTVVAILEKEPGYEAYAGAISRDPTRLMSTASFLETAIVMTSKKPLSGRRWFYEFILATATSVVGFEKEQMRKAIEAYLAYGKGRSPAALNFGDCISYALAAVTGEALLFKGGDFSKTDVRKALDGPF